MQHFSREIPQNYHIFTSTLIPSNLGPRLNNPCLFKGSLSLHPQKRSEVIPIARVETNPSHAGNPVGAILFRDLFCATVDGSEIPKNHRLDVSKPVLIMG